MVFISLIILFASVIYLVVGLLTQKELKQEFADEAAQLKEQMDEALAQFQDVSEPILTDVANVYGEEVAQAIREELIEEDMPEELLLLSWGDPAKILASYVRGTNVQRWYYDEYVTPAGETNYKTEVLITNNRITGMTDLL